MVEDLKRMPNHCPDPEFLAVYIDGQLSLGERTLVEEHLLDCRRCRHIVAIALKSEDSVAFPSNSDLC